MSFDANAWSAVSAIAAAASAVLTLATVVIAVVTLRGARADAEAAAKQAADDRREELRPYLTPELEHELLSETTFNLVIKNWGRTAATDVAVTFDPPPPSGYEQFDDRDMMRWLYQAYSKPIPLWPPKWRMSNVYRDGHENTEALTVSITYKGPDGHPYDDTFTLDPEPLMWQTTSGRGTSAAGDLEKQQVAWLRRLTYGVEALVRTIR